MFSDRAVSRFVVRMLRRCRRMSHVALDGGRVQQSNLYMNLHTVSDPRLPLYQRLKEEFSRCIGDQRWVPGVPIPAESELAASFGVAVGTVRKAVDHLVADGLLQRYQG